MFRSRPATLLDRTCCKKASRSGPWISSRPMWDTSNRLQKCRVYRCSATIPVGYWTGISHPPKSTMEAPAATWISYSWVRLSSLMFLPPYYITLIPSFVPLVLLRLLRLSSRWTFSGRIVDTPRRRLGHAPETFWTHKKAQNRFRQFCASVFVPERFPAGAGCTFGVRTGRTLRSIVVVRPFCLRASAFPFGAAAAVSPGPVIRTLFACHP